jgi:nucleoside-triphosphatase
MGTPTVSAAKVLLTGRPGVGKTTVLHRTLALLDGLRVAGFTTREQRTGGVRVGFEATTLDGRSRVLAHVDTRSGCRVGRYGVDVAGFERDIVSSIEMGLARGVELIVIDEIGKMECFSLTFVEATRRALDSPVAVLGTIARLGGGFIAEVRARSDVELVDVTRANRDQLPAELAARLMGSRRATGGAWP